MASEWYWSRGQERFGPFAAPAFIAQLKDGTVQPADLVWTESMTEWKAAGSVAAVAKYLPARQPAAASAQPQPAQPQSAEPQAVYEPAAEESPAASVGYFNPVAGLPPRAADALRGHANPVGDVSDWPLDDARVMDFRQAFKLRQAVMQSANLAKLLMALNAIGAAILLVFALFTLSEGRHNSGGVAVALMVADLFVTAFAVLYGLAWKATLKSQRWAPVTVTTLLSIGTAFSIISTMIGSANSNRSDTQFTAVIVVVISLVIGGAFIAVAAKGITAIPKYLQTPAWCQELLSQTTV
jgi:cation transport ATPase